MAEQDYKWFESALIEMHGVVPTEREVIEFAHDFIENQKH